MNPVRTTHRLLDAFGLFGEKRAEVENEIILTAIIVAMQAVPPPKPETVGVTADEQREALEDIAFWLGENEASCAAMAAYFIRLVEPVREILPGAKQSAVDDVLSDLQTLRTA
jgi:hypothetical protein